MPGNAKPTVSAESSSGWGPSVREEPAEKAGLRNAWSRVAREYDERWSAATSAYLKLGLDQLHLPPDGHGLDVACGPGTTTAALSDRLPQGTALGVDFAPAMIERAEAELGGHSGVAFAIDDAENLAQPDDAFDVVTCAFGLMYCYDGRSAMRHMARVLRPGGVMLHAVWGPAPRVWFSPVIELIETRAAYFSAVCPMMFFYGLPGVLPRMATELGLEVVLEEHVVDQPMSFSSAAEAADTAILAGPLAGLYANRLDGSQQAEVREALIAHVESLCTLDGGTLHVPAEVSLIGARRPA